MKLCRSVAGLAATAILVCTSSIAQELESEFQGLGPLRPTTIAFAPGVDHQCYIAEKAGRIWVFRSGSLLPTPFLDLSAQVNDIVENGLIGLVFDPDFLSNGHFYVAYTTGLVWGDSMISRFTVQAGSVDIADPMSEQIIFGPIAQPSAGHKGGDLEFGPDGMLYHGIGDGDAGSMLGLGSAQDLADPRGKVLRFDVGLPHPHIPADNPFVNTPGANGLVWAYGFRNPYRIDFDPATGDLYVGDVGGDDWEEVTLLPAGTSGQNGGWPCREGIDCRTHPSCTCPDPSFTEPIVAQSHQAPDDACAVILGGVYRGAASPSLQGKLLFGDYCRHRYFAVEDPTGAANVIDLTGEINPTGFNFRFPVDFVRDNDGEFWAVEYFSGKVMRIVPRCGFQIYCSSTTNSSGNSAGISAMGSSSIASADLTLEVDGLPANAFGYFLVAQTRTFVPNLGGGQGNLCIGAPILRWSLRIQNSGPTGQVSMFTDLSDLPSGVQVESGLTWNFQYWTRDANPNVTSNTSDGLAVTFCP